MADLLLAMLPHLSRLGPCLVIRWMRSHGTQAGAQADGVPASAWEGNNAADRAAKDEAQRLAPSTSISLERTRHQNLHIRVCKLIAAVQEAHMEVVRHHPPPNTPIANPALRWAMRAPRSAQG